MIDKNIHQLINILNNYDHQAKQKLKAGEFNFMKDSAYAPADSYLFTKRESPTLPSAFSKNDF